MTSSATGDALTDNMSTRPRLGSVVSVFTESVSGQPGFTDDVTNDVTKNGCCMEVSGLSGMDNSGFVADPEEASSFDELGGGGAYAYRDVSEQVKSVTYVSADDGYEPQDLPDMLKSGKVSTKDRLKEYGFIKMVGRKKYVVNPSPGKFFRRKPSSGEDSSRRQGSRSISKSKMSSVARRLQRSPSPRAGVHLMEEERQLLMSDPHHQVRGKPPRPGKVQRSRHLSA